MATEPEIIPPGQKSSVEAEAERRSPIARLVSLLDDAFRIPGTRLRFGLDPLIGLIPGVGDAAGAIVAFVLIFAGWRRGLRKVTLLRMMVNIAIDGLVGTIPVVGDLFDFVWKCNRRNYVLLQRAERHGASHHTGRDWAFLAAIALLLAALALLPVLMLAWIVHLLRA